MWTPSCPAPRSKRGASHTRVKPLPHKAAGRKVFTHMRKACCAVNKEPAHLRMQVPHTIVFTFRFGELGQCCVSLWQINPQASSKCAGWRLLILEVKQAVCMQLRYWTVDGAIYAHPLYVPDVEVNGSIMNLVFAATEHSSVYSFNPGSISW